MGLGSFASEPAGFERLGAGRGSDVLDLQRVTGL